MLSGCGSRGHRCTDLLLDLPMGAWLFKVDPQIRQQNQNFDKYSEGSADGIQKFVSFIRNNVRGLTDLMNFLRHVPRGSAEELVHVIFPDVSIFYTTLSADRDETVRTSLWVFATIWTFTIVCAAGQWRCHLLESQSAAQYRCEAGMRRKGCMRSRNGVILAMLLKRRLCVQTFVVCFLWARVRIHACFLFLQSVGTAWCLAICRSKPDFGRMWYVCMESVYLWSQLLNLAMSATAKSNHCCSQYGKEIKEWWMCSETWFLVARHWQIISLAQHVAKHGAVRAWCCQSMVFT